MKSGWRILLGLSLAAALGCPLLIGCGQRATQPVDVQPAVQTESLQLGDEPLVGVKLLMANGRPWAFLIRGGKGIVACPHIDIASLGKAGVPAATAQNWSHGSGKEHGFVGQLGEKVLKVNEPATALGVKPGMTVEEALRLMSDRRRAGQ